MKVILEPDDRKQLANLMAGWVSNVESPDEPLFGIAGTPGLLSPRQLVQAVQDETELGRRYIENLSEVVAQVALENVLEDRFR